LDTSTISTFFALSAVAILTLVALTGVVWLLSIGGGPAAAWKSTIVVSLGDRAVLLAWLVAVIATAGSLYYSEVAGFEPCAYCWYQRIAMYPLAVILGVAAWRRDRSIHLYAIPLAAIGGAIAVYHYLVQRFPDLSTGSCSATAPCSGIWVWELGFVTIPVMAFACFAAIIALLGIGRSHAATNR
jgi:disulfide bond formation protein DsbB